MHATTNGFRSGLRQCWDALWFVSIVSAVVDALLKPIIWDVDDSLCLVFFPFLSSFCLHPFLFFVASHAG
jgi:hypothetical protein